jgi:hypothetical protein
MIPTWLKDGAFVAACLVLPIAWGWAVNWLFLQWRRRANGLGNSHLPAPRETPFTDYQI